MESNDKIGEKKRASIEDKWMMGETREKETNTYKEEKKPKPRKKNERCEHTWL
jgi:hypothetical protein